MEIELSRHGQRYFACNRIEIWIYIFFIGSNWINLTKIRVWTEKQTDQQAISELIVVINDDIYVSK